MKNRLTKLRRDLDALRESPAYRAEKLALELTEEIHTRMETLGMGKSELGRQLGTSPAYVTKVLRGTNNFTLESLVKLADALEASVSIHLSPKGTSSVWVDVVANRRQTLYTKSESGGSTATTKENHEPFSIAA